MNLSVGAEWWRALPEGAEAELHGRSDSRAVPPKTSAFRAVLVLLFIMILAPQALFPALAPFRIALVAAFFAVVSYLKDRLGRQEHGLVWHRELCLAGALLVWALVTVPFSFWPGGSLSFVLDIYLKTLVLFWLLAGTVDTTERLRKTAWALTLMAIPLAATTLQHFASSDVPGAKRILGYEAPLTANPNDLALMLNLVLPFTLALFLLHEGFFARLFLVGCMALDAGAIFATFSRAGFLTLSAVALFSCLKLLGRRERGFAFAALALALMSMPFWPEGYVERLATITDVESDPTGSAQERWADTFGAGRLILANPVIGAGAGQGSLALNTQRGGMWREAMWKDVHNVYLEYAVELGLPGLALFLTLLARCIWNARRVQRECRENKHLRDLTHLAEGVETALWAFVIEAFFHPVAYQPYFYWLAGLAVAVRLVNDGIVKGAVIESETALPWWSRAAAEPAAGTLLQGECHG
jgi:O-antigen ligase